MRNKLEGIGGWLLLLTIGLILNTLSLLFLTYQATNWINVIPDATYIFIIYLVSLILMIIVLYLEFKKHNFFPKAYIFIIWFSLLSISLRKYIFPLETNEKIFSPIMILSAVIWTLYILKSKRVKNTFKNRK